MNWMFLWGLTSHSAIADFCININLPMYLFICHCLKIDASWKLSHFILTLHLVAFINRMFGFISLISFFSCYSSLKRWRKLRHLSRSHILLWFWLCQNALNSVLHYFYFWYIHILISVYELKCTTSPVVGQIMATFL